jgi:hypothetical protein
MQDFFKWPDAAPALGMTILFLSVAGVILGWKFATEWRKKRLGEMRNELTRSMVEAGMSADDIVRVLHAATEADEVVRVLQAAKGGPPESLSSTPRPGDRYRLQAADSRS